MKKFFTLEKYLAESDFLREAAEFHFKLKKNLSEVQPLNLPPRDEVLKLVTTEKIPLFSKKNFKLQSSTLPKNFCRESWQKIFCGTKICRWKNFARLTNSTRLWRGKFFGRRLINSFPPNLKFLSATTGRKIIVRYAGDDLSWRSWKSLMTGGHVGWFAEAVGRCGIILGRAVLTAATMTWRKFISSKLTQKFGWTCVTCATVTSRLTPPKMRKIFICLIGRRCIWICLRKKNLCTNAEPLNWSDKKLITSSFFLLPYKKRWYKWQCSTMWRDAVVAERAWSPANNGMTCPQIFRHPLTVNINRTRTWRRRRGT